MAVKNCRYTNGFQVLGKRNRRKHPEMPAIARDLETLAIERTTDGFVVLVCSVPDHRHNVLTPRAVEELSLVLDDLAAGLLDRGTGALGDADAERGWGVGLRVAY